MHPRLDEIVRRHLGSPDLTPLPAHTVEAFERVRSLVRGPVVLDSGCGTGASTRRLATLHPEATVIGIDKSAHRLRRSGLPRQDGVRTEGRAVLVRAEAAAFWRLALEAGWSVSAHYLLYPNPWPKRRHLMRRWHGHPAFAALLALGPIELRTNDAAYAAEFATALRICGWEATAEPFTGDGISPFEAKYAARQQTLHRVVGRRACPSPPTSPR